METIDGEWIRARLTGRHGEKAELADFMRVKRDIISKILGGKRRVQPEEIPRVLAFFNELPGVRRVPVISWVSAGPLADRSDGCHVDVIDSVSATELPDGDWIGFRVEGTSMDRISPPGSVILVNRRERQLVPNACYVIADANGAATYKRYRPDPARFEPVSTEDGHTTIFPDNTPQIIGRVRRTALEL